MEFKLVTCDVCGIILPLTGGNIVECQSCDKHFCLDCCEADFSDQAQENGYWGECQFCTGNDATTEQLLEYAVKRLHMTVEQLKEEFLRR